MTDVILPVLVMLALGTGIVLWGVSSATALVAAMLILAALVYGIALARVTGRVIGSARAFAAESTRLGAEGVLIAGAVRFPVLAEAWRGYRATLVVDPRTGRLAGRLAADEFFQAQALGRVVDLGIFASVPGVLVGLGLYFTFLGLALALAATGSGLAATDPAIARQALERLFGVAAFKFTTSLVAMACSLLFTLAERRRSFEVQRALAILAQALDELFPPLELTASYPGEAAVAKQPAAATATSDLARAARALEALATNMGQGDAANKAEALGRLAGEAAAQAVVAQLTPLTTLLQESAAGAGLPIARALEAELTRSLGRARAQADAELLAFRTEASKALELFLVGSSQMLARPAAAIEAASTQLVAVLQTEAHARQEEASRHDRAIQSLESALTDLTKFAGGVGLYTGERIMALQKLAETSSQQAERVDATYHQLVDRMGGAMKANNEHMARFLSQAEARQGQFFQAYDQAVERLVGELLKSANYLAEAADRRFEGA